MTPLLHLMTALTALLANRLRTALTLLGVVIGVLAMIALVSLGEGLRAYLMTSFTGMGTSLIQVFPGRRDAKGLTTAPLATARKLTEEDVLALRRRAGSLDSLIGIVNGTGTVKAGGRQRDVAVAGVGEQFTQIRMTRIGEGRFLREDDLSARRPVCVLGHRVAEELFGTEGAVGQAVRVAGRPFHVVGVMVRRGVSLGFDLDDQVFIPTTTAMDLFGAEGLSSILARARDPRSVEGALAEISEVLRGRHGGQVDFTVVSQDDLLGTLDRVMDTLTLVLAGIAGVALLVGGIGIANIMLVSVHERTREIGVRRSVGARRRDILWQFLIESALIGILGGGVGLLISAAFMGLGRVLMPELPLSLSPGVVAMALGFSGATGLLAGVLPARRGAMLDPVEALRHE
jgi:putative ABC transport system permease protein